MKVHYPKLYNMAHLLALNVLLLPKDLTSIFSSPVRKYRKSYCSHPGVGVGVSVGFAQNVKVFG